MPRLALLLPALVCATAPPSEGSNQMNLRDPRAEDSARRALEAAQGLAGRHMAALRASWSLVPIIVASATSSVAAQTAPTVPPCGRAPADSPCRAAVDSAPVLEYQPPVPDTGEDARTPFLWIHVDSTGAVHKAHVHRPTGVDWDLAALERAKQFRFRPATLNGSATSAWVYLAVVGVPQPATCADAPSSVPLSAGGQFVDSTVLERPELGTRFRYAAPAGFPMDVFIYPAIPSASPEFQVRETLQALAAGVVTGGPDSIRVLQVRTSADRGTATRASHHVRRLQRSPRRRIGRRDE